MNAPKIPVDWSRLLGFDQAKPGADVLRNAPKIGNKPCQAYREFSGPPLDHKPAK